MIGVRVIEPHTLLSNVVIEKQTEYVC